MKALETELQVRLFEPSGRSVRLTPVGEEVVAAARVTLDDVDHVVAVARAHVGSPDPLVVVTTPTLEPLFTRHFLPAYYDHHPDRSARIRRASGREEVVSLLLAGEAMVGLTDLPVPDDVVVVPLGEFEVVLLSPADSELPAEIDWSDLDQVPLILPSTGSTRRVEFDAFFSLLGIQPVVALESDERGSWLEGCAGRDRVGPLVRRAGDQRARPWGPVVALHAASATAGRPHPCVGRATTPRSPPSSTS